MQFSSITQDNVAKVTDFFAYEIQNMLYLGYSKEDINWNIHEHHNIDSLSEAIKDNENFFEIAMVENEIIGYIEMRKSSNTWDQLNFWWVFVRHDFQWQWIAQTLHQHAEKFAQEKWYNQIWSSSTNKNISSIKLHKILEYTIIQKDDLEIFFEKILSK